MITKYSDELNPKFMFQGIDTSILTKAVRGEIDLMELVKEELIGRGVDSSGTWVNPDNARKSFSTEF